jgi:hypothetical protein
MALRGTSERALCDAIFRAPSDPAQCKSMLFTEFERNH